MLTLRVSGKKDQLRAFMKHFSSQPYYKIMLEEAQNTEEMTTKFEFLTTMLKPSIRKSLTVTLQTKQGQALEIDLLDGQVIEVDENTTCVYGKNFDIFADR